MLLMRVLGSGHKERSMAEISGAKLSSLQESRLCPCLNDVNRTNGPKRRAVSEYKVYRAFSKESCIERNSDRIVAYDVI